LFPFLSLVPATALLPTSIMGWNNVGINRSISSNVILITAETACILTTETIGIVFYNYSILLGIPLALLVGALTVVVIEAHKKINIKSKSCGSCDCNDTW
jgi:hypothetical protein